MRSSSRKNIVGQLMSQEFEWDKDKAASNKKKHDVTFEEAATVFADPLAAIFDDEVHSEEEQREIIVGHSEKIDCCWFVLWSVPERFGSLALARRRKGATRL